MGGGILNCNMTSSLDVMLQFPFHNPGENVWDNFFIVIVSSKS